MSEWAHFLVRDIDRRLLRRMRKDAEREGRSLSDFMRQVLCEHYELDCPPSKAPSRLEFGARTQLLRLHPALRDAIKEDAERWQVSMQSLVHEALEAHYPEEEMIA